MNNFIALICGLVFGFGLTIAQMVNPNKVLNFLDLFGSWDASLAFVMGGGVITYIIGYQLFIKKMKKPLLTENFNIPTNTVIDQKLIIGSTIFGIGWGIAGICPGPAIANITTGNEKILVFILLMVVGMLLAQKVKKR
ncbi:YeeE/YedE family protein [Thalassotalea sp. 42_200_T64]|nr:YeeE/YedE family protein [Thalassotalea sp. 42_200_T64]